MALVIGSPADEAIIRRAIFEVKEQENIMHIGIFRVGPPANLRGRAYAEFHDRLKPLVKIEMKGLSFEGASVVKSTSSNWCTLYILNNGAQLIKYRSRYAIVAATKRALDETSRLLQVADIEIMDAGAK